MFSGLKNWWKEPFTHGSYCKLIGMNVLATTICCSIMTAWMYRERLAAWYDDFRTFGIFHEMNLSMPEEDSDTDE